MTWLWLIAGPNGSGKTTLLRRGILQASIPGLPASSLSADTITASLAESGVEQDTANVAAANLIDGVLRQTVQQRRPVLVETVLSSEKYLGLVAEAQADGTQIGLLYVTLRAGIDHVRRVAARAKLGGHDVAIEKILSRRAKSHTNLWRFAKYANVVLVFDNSEIANPVLIASCKDSAWTVFQTGRLPDLDDVLARLASPRER